MPVGTFVDLFEEYQQQQQWRDWPRYLQHIPMRPTDSVVDFGCSVGGVARLLASRVSKVVGIDVNPQFIEFCRAQRLSNQHFICADFQQLALLPLAPIDGVWSSFSLSYLRDPLSFLRALHVVLTPGGWIALLDVSCFLSGNLRLDSQYYESVRRFELASHQSGVYDFNFGATMVKLLQEAGFTIQYVDHDVVDLELNFAGAASQAVLDGWAARLARMPRLQALLGLDYADFCQQLLANLASKQHQQRGNVRFVVATKSTTAMTATE